MSSYQKLPKLLVFDLDYTLWPFWIDTHVTPPFKKDMGRIVDLNGRKVDTYPESLQVLETVKGLNIKIGVASRTSEIEGANQLIHLLGWRGIFDFVEIYPGWKVPHFGQFRKYTRYEFEDMLFFDDEPRNIRDVSELNVTCILVQNGMSLKVLHEGLSKFEENNK